jgi:hypothetical protein
VRREPGRKPSHFEALVHPGSVTTTELTRSELEVLVAEQRRFLTVSCTAFDAGDHAEGKRIATCLRELLQDLQHGQALLAELGTRDLIEWLDTAGSLLPLVGREQLPLVVAGNQERAGQTGAAWLPTLDAWDRRLQERPHLPPSVEESLARMRAEHTLRSRGQWLRFAEWWEADVMCDVDGQKFTRADLVTTLTDPDSGVRVTPAIEETHRRRPRWDSSGWASQLDDHPHVPPLGPTLASVRQVAFEVQMSLHRAERPGQG